MRLAGGVAPVGWGDQLGLREDGWEVQRQYADGCEAAQAAKDEKKMPQWQHNVARDPLYVSHVLCCRRPTMVSPLPLPQKYLEAARHESEQAALRQQMATLQAEAARVSRTVQQRNAGCRPARLLPAHAEAVAGIHGAWKFAAGMGALLFRPVLDCGAALLLQRERELAAKNQLAREEAAKRKREEQARQTAERLQQMKERWKTQATVQQVRVVGR